MRRMNARAAAIAALLAVLPASPALAGGKADNAAVVSFHLEADANDNPKMIFPQLAAGEMRNFKRMPEIMVDDIEGFAPFPSEDGQTYGVAFKLKSNAARRLSAITATNEGRWMLSQVGGQIIEAVLIDKQVDDGIIVVWRGVTIPQIEQFEKAVPRLGAAKR